ncbi:hypothetical protein [Pleionea litopenaei]|uniref:Uncharacterized protein n=1 Tax=Pleionea litopenaei TaxID=3070815 RepID=A0AA51X5W4_9GAMM|nr:hypothetical protein [Pleionea sp. HL-JVS1]WMS86171.1 hypothetical protein Q9312_13175 [Pleionea sp. HL-JVS1]
MSEFDPYQSSETTEISLADQLISEQNIWGTALGTFIGAFPGMLAYLLLLSFPMFAVVCYVVPGLSMGLFASFMGRGLTKIHRVVSALTGLVILLGIGYLLQLTSATIGLTLINCVIAAMLANRFLTREQADAVFDYQIGLTKLRK